MQEKTCNQIQRTNPLGHMKKKKKKTFSRSVFKYILLFEPAIIDSTALLCYIAVFSYSYGSYFSSLACISWEDRRMVLIWVRKLCRGLFCFKLTCGATLRATANLEHCEICWDVVQFVDCTVRC